MKHTHTFTETEINTMIAWLLDGIDDLNTTRHNLNPEDATYEEDTEWLTHETAELRTIINKLNSLIN